MNNELEKIIEKSRDPAKAKNLQRFFKTGRGEYGEGDIFIGISVPVQRKIAKEFKDISLKDVEELLDSRIHEKRLIALLILIKKYERAIKDGKEEEKKNIYDTYLKEACNNKINNWDLIDLSAPRIVGNYLLDKNRKILYQLATSMNLWEKRIAIISTAAFIKNKDFNDTIKISEILLRDKHDLIHKAVGWMLREVGKRDAETLRNFLKKHSNKMPRTMLRYSIEKFSDDERKKWLNESKIR